MSKSQKRKQRLIEKGISLADGANKSIVPASFPSARLTPGSGSVRNKSRAARRRARRGTTGASRLPRASIANQYLDALINPEMGTGVKIPDEIGYPTGTFQLTAKGTLSILSGGDSVAIVAMPAVSSNSATGNAPINIGNGATTGNVATWTAVQWAQRSAVMALYSETRPVSAVLEVSYIGPSTQDSGMITAGCSFVRGLGSAKYQGTTWTDQSYLPDQEVWPAKNGARVVWKPLDNSNFEFSDYSSTTYMADQFNRIPVLAVVVTGTPFAGAQYMYEFVANFEGVPGTDQASLVDTEPSPFSAEALRKAFAWAQEASNNVRPLVGVVGQAMEFGRTAYNLFQGGSRQLIGKGKYRQSSPVSMLPIRTESMTDSGGAGKEEEELVGDVDNLSINPTAPPLESVVSHRSVVRAPAHVGGYSSQGTSSPYMSRKT